MRASAASWGISDRPWDKVGVDSFEFNNYNFLDYLSDFWEIDSLEKASANSVIRTLKAHFARYPSIVVSDDGPQFRCDEFKDFARIYDFKHQTSSPHYPESNGIQVEIHNKKKKAKNLKSAYYYNKNANYLKPLQEANVRVEPTVLGDKVWKRGTVNRKLDEKYEVQINGGVLRRNRVHLQMNSDRQLPSVTE
ncbi:uncharacterized protein LOC119571704 [Penaeus monodon]|uniref:uncharacterized protein LOC119571704 n=1 Tax=Penaeus monodon TaxID=6687 RepID=UPI0018A710BA|nr:uncharacterized protein LOC119571704 [Penaeus monodon]